MERAASRWGPRTRSCPRGHGGRARPAARRSRPLPRRGRAGRRAGRATGRRRRRARPPGAHRRIPSPAGPGIRTPSRPLEQAWEWERAPARARSDHAVRVEKLGEEDADAEPCCGGEGGETPRPAGLANATKQSSCLGRARRSGYQAGPLARSSSSDPAIGSRGPLCLPGPRHEWALVMCGRPAFETDRARFKITVAAVIGHWFGSQITVASSSQPLASAGKNKIRRRLSLN